MAVVMPLVPLRAAYLNSIPPVTSPVLPEEVELGGAVVAVEEQVLALLAGRAIYRPKVARYCLCATKMIEVAQFHQIAPKRILSCHEKYRNETWMPLFKL